MQRTEAPPPAEAPHVQDVQETQVVEVHQPSPDPVAPLLGERPLSLRTVESTPPAGPVQRTSTDTPAPSPAATSEPTPVPVRWVTGPETVQRATRHPVTRAEPGAPHALVQRSTAAQAAPPPAPAAAPSFLPGSRAAVPGHGSLLDAGAVAVAAGVAQRMADGSVVFTPPSAAPHAPSLPFASQSSAPAPFAAAPAAVPSYPATPVVHRLPVQREVTAEEPPPPEPEPAPPSAPAEPAPPSATSATAAPAEASAPGPGPGHQPQSAHQTPPVTDEFVRALYPPLARLLKADLRLERERAGFLIEKR
ncbi:hypothetical protein ACFYU9_19350 [Streptomyces sp. NPDC004327]|uniref:hypothetical protein n=1 Tax=Streptomyces sp. NPDC004327 TaxID=3364699 RepID=UPI00369B917F